MIKRSRPLPRVYFIPNLIGSSPQTISLHSIKHEPARDNNESFIDIMSADGNCRRQPHRMKRNERTPPSSVCPYALTSEELDARMISARQPGGRRNEMSCDLQGLWPDGPRTATSPLDRRLLNGVCERGPVGGTVSSIYLSPTDPVSIWPLRWVTNTLNWYSEQSELQPTVSCCCTPWCLSDNIINICLCVCYKRNKDLGRGSEHFWNVAWAFAHRPWSSL